MRMSFEMSRTHQGQPNIPYQVAPGSRQSESVALMMLTDNGESEFETRPTCCAQQQNPAGG